MDETPAEDRAFERFRTDGDGAALAELFDRTAPALLAMARTTIADGHLAEDLVQQTFVAAIEARADWNAELRVLPWLMGVLANRARNLRRREQRRSHERLDDGEFEASFSGSDPHQAAADHEIDRVMRDAIDELPEPYGAVLDMHLRHGLTAAEIARSLRRPAGTVRTQIVRGSRMLRAAMPAGFAAAGVTLALAGDALAAMRARVLDYAREASALAVRAAGGGAAVAALPLILMPKFFLIVTAAVVAALSFALAWSPWDPEPPRPAEPSIVTSAGSGQPSATEDGAVVQSHERTAGTRSEPVAAPTQLLVRVLQEWDGAPANLVGVRVRGSDEGVTDHATGTDGVAICGDPAAVAQVELPDFDMTAPVPEFDGGRAELEFRVPPRLEVEVRVVDLAGKPVANAELASFRGGAFESERIVLGTTDAAGRARLRTAQGFLSLRAEATGQLPSSARLLTARRAPRGVVTLQLGDPTGLVRVRVSEPGGAPAADALVQVFLLERQRMRPLWARTGQDGIALVGLPEERVVVFVAARDEASARYAVVELPSAARAATLSIELQQAARIRGVVRDIAGSPVAGVEVRASWRDARLPSPLIRSWSATAKTAPNGAYVIGDLVPGGVHAEVANSGRDATTDLEVAVGQVGEWNPVVPVPATWRLTLVDPEGDPLAGWFVELASDSPDLGAPQAVTDARGEVVFPGLVAPTVRVSATAPLPAGSGATFDVTAASRWDGVSTAVTGRLAVPEGAMPNARLTGVVIGSDGMPDGKARVRVLRRADESVRTVELDCDAAGRFEYGPTVPGTVTLVAVAGGDSALRSDLRLERGRSLDLGRVFVGASSTVAVSLRLALQSPTVELRLGEGREVVPLERGEDARWRTRAAVPPGHYVLVVRDGGAVVREQSFSLESGKDAVIEVR
ncbi:MAG: sigma-70 family RNA polymerase sigma factor [bacterium]|nr:sigma-70 family RNA polymerase sigma factor [bacterium]